MKTLTEDQQTRIRQLIDLGFALSSTAPSPDVSDKDWPNIHYAVSLKFNGRLVLTTDYRLGIGHVDLKKARPDSSFQRWTNEEYSMLNAWMSKPNANFTNKALQAQVAAKLAGQQKVTPQLDEVLHALLSDGEAYMNALTFEAWAGELGYDIDSRKAEAIYKLCDEIGRKLVAGVPREVLDKALEITSEV